MAHSVNLRRGLIRLWVVISIVWVGVFLPQAARDWVRFARDWTNKEKIMADIASQKYLKF
jgi:hypothetical protein